MRQRAQLEDKLLQAFFLEQPSMTMRSAKDEFFMLRGFTGKGILSEYCENGQKNAEAENDCNKLILGEMCSIRAAGLPHHSLLMFPCHHINLVFHQPHLLVNITWPQKSSAATYSHIRVKTVAAGGMFFYLYKSSRMFMQLQSKPVSQAL